MGRRNNRPVVWWSNVYFDRLVDFGFCNKLCKKMESYFQSNSVMNSLKCPKSKSLSHCLTELFPIYQNKHWTIRLRDDCSVDPSSHHNILKVVGFLEDFWYQSLQCFFWGHGCKPNMSNRISNIKTKKCWNW